jgi:alkanesulfonate monooxygenase SsuD/methylene tetrahydromethanopterin reductase-like flavin-dependent oxidoreductase (luciferase family)
VSTAVGHVIVATVWWSSLGDESTRMIREGVPMDVGIQTLFASAGWDDITDAQVYEEDTSLALLAEEVGFDVVWAVEHHFYDYSFCPDNTQWLAYIAGRTERIDVGTAAIILPWNDPLRVAEKVALLDQIASGRLRLGFGRGLSRREYSHFRGIEMDESRDRFDESSLMVQQALETGFIEGDGPHYPQPRTPIRPAPQRTFRGRTYAVATSDDSLEAAARLRASMVMFSDRSWRSRLGQIETWRTRYRELHADEPPPPLICDFVYCHADEDVAANVGPRYLAAYLESVLEHYEVTGHHFDGLKGYEAYAGAAGVLRRMGASGFLDGFLDATCYGTPQQIIDKYRARWELIGPFEAAPAFRFGGIPFDEAEASMRLFATEVLPELRSW